jgi:hypothetical protein
VKPGPTFIVHRTNNMTLNLSIKWVIVLGDSAAIIDCFNDRQPGVDPAWSDGAARLGLPARNVRPSCKHDTIVAKTAPNRKTDVEL